MGSASSSEANFGGKNVSYNAIVVKNKTKEYATYAKAFVAKNDYNTQYCVLIDMAQHSSKDRLFIVDLKKDSIIKSGLVAHGTGSEKRNENGNLVFSNVDGSLCTSLGKYKIGKNYNGMYGYSYRLYGLDSSNNNAFKRAIVLHSHQCVPVKMIDNIDYPICYSYGCPMVSKKLLDDLKVIINKSPKPILMWIYK